MMPGKKKTYFEHTVTVELTVGQNEVSFGVEALGWERDRGLRVRRV